MAKILWLSPLFTISIAFITSGIKKYRFQRYWIYCVVLFTAFIFNLQSLSFSNEYYDILFSHVLLLILADFFWRGVKLKNIGLRIGAGIIGSILLVFCYKDWVRAGEEAVSRYYESIIVNRSGGSFSGYYLKKRGVLKPDSIHYSHLEFYRLKTLHLLEQKLSDFYIPDGYEQARFSYNWDFQEGRIMVKVIGDNDTLWTLKDPGPPK